MMKSMLEHVNKKMCNKYYYPLPQLPDKNIQDKESLNSA